MEHIKFEDRRRAKDRRSGQERRKENDPRYGNEKKNEQKPKVELDIPKEILDKTTDCNMNFLCMSGDVEHLCEVNDTIGRICLVRSKLGKSCLYQKPFGSSFICGCPTRLAIYNQYKI